MLSWRRHGHGEDVVLIPGFLGSGMIFTPLIEQLSDDFTLTTIDLPGFGESRGIAVPPTVEEISDLVIDTILSIGLNRVSLLGHSLGAMVALEIALARPELLDKLVIYGGCPDGYLPGRFETTEESVAKVRRIGIEETAASIAAEWFQQGRDHPNYELARAAGAGSDEEGVIVHLRSWDGWKARDRIANIRTPTLIICGDSDRSTHPDLSVEMWKKIPGSQLFIAPGAGHAVHLEQPEIFNAIAKGLLL